MSRPTRTTGGFTLIELLVVIAIIGILAALLLPTLTAVRCRSKESAAQSTIRDMESAIKAYESDYARFPPDAIGGGNPNHYNWPLVWALSRPGSRGTAYYSFRREHQGDTGGNKWAGTFADQLATNPPAGAPSAATVPCFYSPMATFGAADNNNISQYFYIEWQSKPTPKTDATTGAACNPFSFDMWTGSCVLLGTAGTDIDKYGGNTTTGKGACQINNWR